MRGSDGGTGESETKVRKLNLTAGPYKGEPKGLPIACRKCSDLNKQLSTLRRDAQALVDSIEDAGLADSARWSRIWKEWKQLRLTLKEEG